MEQLLQQIKEAIRIITLSSYKLFIICRDKIIEFIEMLKRVFKKDKKKMS